MFTEPINRSWTVHYKTLSGFQLISLLMIIKLKSVRPLYATQFVMMDSKLHVLCDLCQRLKFDAQQASSDRGWDGELQQHAANLVDLNTSASNGCHLCSLFASGLKYCRGIETSSPRRKVTVEYIPHHRTGVFPRPVGYSDGERLEIRYGSMWVPLYIESLPPRKCYSEDQYSNISTKDLKSIGTFHLQYWSKLLQPPHPSCTNASILAEMYLFR